MTSRPMTLVPRAATRAPVIAALAAGKGGLGTSTAAALLAATIASRQQNVLLVDGSDRFGTLDVLLGVTPGRSLVELKGGGAEPEELLVRIDDGLTLLQTGDHADAPALSPTERRILYARLVALFPRYDLVLIDAGASAASVLEACAAGVTRLLAVTAGDRITVTATYALVKLLHARCPGVRVDLLATRLPEAVATHVRDCLDTASRRFLGKGLALAGVIPSDPQFAAAIAAGLGAREAAAGSHAAATLSTIGQLLIDTPAPSTDRNGVSRNTRHTLIDAQ